MASRMVFVDPSLAWSGLTSRWLTEMLFGSIVDLPWLSYGVLARRRGPAGGDEAASSAARAGHTLAVSTPEGASKLRVTKPAARGSLS
jgi:hypothetical protein